MRFEIWPNSVSLPAAIAVTIVSRLVGRPSPPREGDDELPPLPPPLSLLLLLL